MEFFLEANQQIENLSLDRDIQRCRRFIRNQEFWTRGERHRNHGPLSQATGELMRILLHALLGRRNGNCPHDLDRPVVRFAPRKILVRLDAFANLLTDGQHRIQGGHRLLKNHRNFSAADLAHVAVRSFQQISCRVATLTIAGRVPDLSASNLPGRLNQPQNGQSRHALAATGLSHHPQGASAPQRERHIIHRAHNTIAVRKVNLQVLDSEGSGCIVYLGARASRPQLAAAGSREPTACGRGGGRDVRAPS